MSIVSAFMTQSIDYIKEVTLDGRHNKTLSVRYQDVPCRWSPGERRVMNMSGEIVEAAVEAWVPANYSNITYDDVVIKDSTNYQIIRKMNRYDLMGNLDHIKLYLV